MNSFPHRGRLAAIDYGTVRIGVAVCDPDWILASPLEVFPVGTVQTNLDYFRRLAKEERIVAWVVGLPIHCDGGESEKSVACRRFANWLAVETGLPVRLFDERFTTVAAQQRISSGKTTRKKTKQRIDAVAAQVLLESFLEACRYRNEIAGHALEDPSRDMGSLDD